MTTGDPVCPMCGQYQCVCGAILRTMVTGPGWTQQNAMTGWQCPVCGQVNAPWVGVCHGYHGPRNDTGNTTGNATFNDHDPVFTEFAAWEAASDEDLAKF